MGKRTHTPGPWQLTWLGSDGSFEISVPGMVIAARAAINHKAEEFNANARLMAAAPDLFEAAKHAAMEWRLHGQLTDSCRVLEAAIAKAEGRA